MLFSNNFIVLAQDVPPVTPVEEAPPPVDTGTVPEQPVDTNPPETTVTEPQPEGALPEPQVVVEPTVEPAPETAPLEASPTDVSPAPAPDNPAAPADEVQPTTEEVIAANVAALVESGSVITSETGETLPLSSVEAADLLAEGDPVIVRGATTYNFLPTGSSCPVGNTCFFSDNPITSAINFAVPGEQIIIAAGTYTENVEVNKDVLLIGGSAGVNVNSFILSAQVTSLSSWLNIFTNNVVIKTDTVGGTQGDIQNGIDLVSSGGTVQVLEGTYELTNSLTISKALTLTGNVGNSSSPGSALDAPVIQPASGGPNTGMSYFIQQCYRPGIHHQRLSHRDPDQWNFGGSRSFQSIHQEQLVR